MYDVHYNVAYNNALLYPEACRYTGSNVDVHRGSLSQFWNRHHTFYVYTHRRGTTAHATEGTRLTMPALHYSWARTVKRIESDHILRYKYQSSLIEANVFIICDNDSSLIASITKISGIFQSSTTTCNVPHTNFLFSNTYLMKLSNTLNP